MAICNVALTIPARVLIGMLLDKFGPRITYSTLLVFSVIPCLLFASAQDFNQLVVARLLLSIVGAGFVIGIRMVAEWFPPKEIGLAEGISRRLGKPRICLFSLDHGGSGRLPVVFRRVHPATGEI